jgi:hypothetical protein
MLISQKNHFWLCAMELVVMKVAMCIQFGDRNVNVLGCGARIPKAVGYVQKVDTTEVLQEEFRLVMM